MKYAIPFLLILLCGLAFANITPTSFEPTTMYGGETVDYNLVIKNDFSYDTNILLDINFWNQSGDFNGMNTLVSPGTSFPLKAYSEQKVVVSFKASPNIYPEQYGFVLTATYYLSDQQTPIRTEYVGSGSSTYYGGGTSIVYKDKNVIVDKNVFVPQIIEKPVEVIKEVPSEPIIKWLPIPNKDKNQSPATGLLQQVSLTLGDIFLIGIIIVIGTGAIIYFAFIRK